MKKSLFDIADFFADTAQLIKSPKDFFSDPNEPREISHSIIRVVYFAFVTIALTAVFSLVLVWLGKGSAAGVFAKVGIQLVLGPLISFIFLFIGTLLVLLASLLTGASKKFDDNVFVHSTLFLASALGPIAPFFSHFSLFMGDFISLLLALFTVWLLYNGLVYGLNGKPLSSKILCGFLAILIILFMGPRFEVFNTPAPGIHDLKINSSEEPVQSSKPKIDFERKEEFSPSPLDRDEPLTAKELGDEIEKAGKEVSEALGELSKEKIPEKTATAANSILQELMNLMQEFQKSFEKIELPKENS